MQAPFPADLHVMAALNSTKTHQQVIGFWCLFVLSPGLVAEVRSTPRGSVVNSNNRWCVQRPGYFQVLGHTQLFRDVVVRIKFRKDPVAAKNRIRDISQGDVEQGFSTEAMGMVQ